MDIFEEGIRKGKENLLFSEGFYKHSDEPFDVQRGANIHIIIIFLLKLL